jgi:ATP-dependent Lhr-like helicase
MPERLRLLSVASARARLLSEARTFACTQCRRYVEEKQIQKLDEKPRCPLCSSNELGMAEETEDEVRRAAELADRGREVALWHEVLETSKLIARYGRLAALALAGRGLTVSAAREILAKEPRFSNRFLEQVLQKERESQFRRFKLSW